MRKEKFIKPGGSKTPGCEAPESLRSEAYLMSVRRSDEE